jgi:hypothetical protein
MADSTFVTRYEDLAHRSLRDVARGLALDALSARSRLTTSRLVLDRPRVQFLVLHHVFEDEEAAFRDLLRDLSALYTFIGYSDAVGRIQSGDVDRPYLAVSFDDGFKNCLRGAALFERSARLGASSCAARSWASPTAHLPIRFVGSG